MQPGAYSSRFKMFQREMTDQVKKDYEDENAELVARNHRLHVETNRRRRAYAQKKKTQAQREERRRELILAKRRQMIQDATDKFQRLNRTTQQSSQFNDNNQKDFNAGPKYTLDEALHAIMGRDDRSRSASIHHDPDRGSNRRPLSVPTDLQSDSRLDLKTSRSLFEQQLLQHQQSLANQQQMALRDFSEAMIGRLVPNGTAKADDRQQGIGSKPDKGTAGHQLVDTNQQGTSLKQDKGIAGHQLVDTNQQRTSLGSDKATAGHQLVNTNQQATSLKSDIGTAGHQPDTNQLGTSLKSDKGTAGNQLDRGGQQTFRIDRAAEGNPFKSLDKPNEWHLHTTNAKNGVESTATYRLPAGGDSTPNRGNSTPNGGYSIPNGGHLPIKYGDATAGNAGDPIANVGSTYNVAMSSAKESKLSNYSGVYHGANGSAPPNTGSTQSKTVINGTYAGTSANSAGSVVQELGSTGGLLLHRSINSPCPNVAIVQPNSHTNLSVSNMSQKPTTELEVDKNSMTNNLTMKSGLEPQHHGQNGEIVANGGRSDMVVGFVSEKTTKGTDPGRFVDINGFTDRVLPANKEAASETHPLDRGPGHAADGSSVKYDGRVVDMVPVSSKVADSDMRSISTYPSFSSTQDTPSKPPTGRWKLSETGGKSGARPPDVERRETRDWNATEGVNEPDGRAVDPTKLITTVEQGLREMDIRQTVNAKQQATSAQQVTSAQQGTSQPEVKPQPYSDEVYVDETSSNSSASSIRPVSRIPVPIGTSGKVPKGILKRRPSSCAGRPDSGQHQPVGMTRSASMTTMSVSLRDSLEVTKQQRRGGEDQKSGKKSVRFAEVLCEEEPDRGPTAAFNNSLASQLSAERVLFYPRPPQQEKLHTEQPTMLRSMRPISAKVISTTTPDVDPNIKIPRVASAGVMRRGPFHNPHSTMPSDSNQPAIMVPGRTSNQLPTNSVGNPAGNGIHPSSNGTPASNVHPLSDKAVRGDISGISLDKTPTEEEINWLWEKVRSCLNRDTSSTSTAGNSNGAAGSGAATRQMVQVSCTNFDGSSLAMKPPTGVTAGRSNNTYVNNYMGSQYPARRRITMETLNAYTKRTNNNSLLQQRKFSQPGMVDQARPSPQTSTYIPVNGIAKSEVSVTTRVNGVNNHVSESMAAFLAAEELTRHSNLDDNLISNVMNAAERRARVLNANPATVTVPSALSIEEDRLMKSIDRLNEKLSGAFPADLQHMNQPVMVTHLPKPPPPPAANKNRHQPFSTRRFINYTGTVPRHYFQINGTTPAINTQFKRTA